MSRLVVYGRISVADDASTSVDRQLTDLRAWAAREGHHIIAELVDHGVSGRKSRAKAAEALAMLADGRAEILGVWKLDRFGRRGARDLADLQDALDARPGARFVALQDGLDSRNAAAWAVVSGTLAGLARAESANTSARVRSSIAHLKASGRWAAGKAPYGFRVIDNPDGPGRVLDRDPAEAAIIREVAARVLAGESTYRVARDLNARGVLTTTRRVPKQPNAPDAAPAPARGWTPTILANVLTGPYMVGRQVHHGNVLRGPDGLPLTVWPPILDVPTWEALKSRLRPSGKPAKRTKAARLLSGLVICGACGRRMRVNPGSDGRARYVCPSNVDAAVDCPGNAVTAAGAEAAVLDRVRSLWSGAEVILVEARESSADADLAIVASDLAQVAAAFAEPDADIDALVSRRAALMAERARLEALAPERVEVRTPTGRSIAGYLDAAEPLEARQQWLGRILPDGVTVAPSAVRGGRFDASRLSYGWVGGPGIAGAEAGVEAIAPLLTEVELYV